MSALVSAAAIVAVVSAFGVAGSPTALAQDADAKLCPGDKPQHAPLDGLTANFNSVPQAIDQGATRVVDCVEIAERLTNIRRLAETNVPTLLPPPVVSPRLRPFPRARPSGRRPCTSERTGRNSRRESIAKRRCGRRCRRRQIVDSKFPRGGIDRFKGPPNSPTPGEAAEGRSGSAT